MLALQTQNLFRTRCYINGVWVNAETGKTMPVHNPANGALLAEVRGEIAGVID